MPPQLLPKSILTPELLTYVLVSKFMDHIPFYRMENIFLRHGLEITRATLCNWTIGVYERYLPLFSFYKTYFLADGFWELMKQFYKFIEKKVEVIQQTHICG
ncbi:MAG: transposase [Leptospiraceae bacterium]|nr:transposase [Leptospiraceae bacterium]